MKDKEIQILENELDLLSTAINSDSVYERLFYINAKSNLELYKLLKRMYQEMCTLKNL